jgi:hypothetical protein
MCGIFDSHSATVEDATLLGCKAVLLGVHFPDVSPHRTPESSKQTQYVHFLILILYYQKWFQTYLLFYVKDRLNFYVHTVLKK